MRTHGAYILARYSTDRQNPDSIEVQVSKCTEWCNAKGLPILDVFADEAVSGMKDDRPQYRRMMTQLASGGADTVVIYDQSRMFRKMTAWFAFRDEIERLGVKVISVTQPGIGGDLRDPTNFLTEGSMALFNQIWALQSRQKVTEKMRFMAKNGQHTGGKPALGYAVEDGRLVICEPEAAIVRSIFADYAGGKSYYEIINDLNASDKRTKNGNRFGPNSIHDLLKNEKYIGTLIYGKVEKRPDGSRNSHRESDNVIRIDNAIPAIVDRDTWDKVQARLAENKRKSPGRPQSAREYPLRGKVFCGECKSAMVVSRSYGSYYYYGCNARKRKGDCDNMPIRVDDLEQQVAAAVRQIMGNPGNVEALLRILRNERDQLHAGAAAQLTGLISRRDDISRKLDAAIDAVLSGLNSPALTKRIQELEAGKAKIEHDMDRLRASVSGSAVDEQHLLSILPAMLNDDAIFALVVRVEVSKTDITIWTLLDADPNGKFDYDNDGLIINLGDGPPAPFFENPGDVDAPGFSLIYQRFAGFSVFIF